MDMVKCHHNLSGKYHSWPVMTIPYTSEVARAHGGRITWNLSSPQENVGNYRARRASAMFCIIIALAHDFSIFSHKNEIGK